MQAVKHQLAQNSLKNKVKRKPQPQPYSTRTNGFGIPAVFNKTAQRGENAAFGNYRNSVRTQGEEDFAVNVQPRRGISLGAQGVSHLTKQMFNPASAISGKGYAKRNGMDSVGQSVTGVSDIEESLNATRQRFYSN